MPIVSLGQMRTRVKKLYIQIPTAQTYEKFYSLYYYYIYIILNKMWHIYHNKMIIYYIFFLSLNSDKYITLYIVNLIIINMSHLT